MKDKIIGIVLSLYLIIFFFIGVIMPDKDVSYNERRNLNQFTGFNISMMDNFENYALDQFPFRDNFRSINTYFNLYIMRNKDTNFLVYKNDYIYKIEYPTNYKSIDNFINMVKKISSDIDNNIYLSVIPDKGYYLDDSYLKLDYDYIFNKVESIDGIKYIPLNDVLNIDDYYYTDTHFEQSHLIKVVDRLSKYMNFDYNDDYKINEYNNFKGVYYGQLGIPIKKDSLYYLTSNSINDAIVDDLEHPLENSVYNLSKLDSKEPYDVFLNGSTPVVTITNEKCLSKKELVIFRDSFGSSLAPLLIDSYYKITLIDLRYIDYNILSDYFVIANQDVLFLYSSLMINNSNSFKY